MNINAFLCRLFNSQSFRLFILLLITLVCGTPAFCGQIHDAASNGDLQKVKALLEKDPKLVASWEDSKNLTPLHFAVEIGREDIVELLLTNKADVNARDKNGNTPLHFAALSSNNNLAELLLAKGVDVNAENNNRETPLQLAMANDNKELIELLRQYGGHP
jgi:ankyrin repeat protein